jgi:uncharacterized membrane protein YhaH (DUF805 family)
MREKYATFSGRASRSEFWWFYLFFLIMLIGAALILGGGIAMVGFSTTMLTVFSVIAGLIYLAILIPFFSVTVRRFHDRNLSGWWYGLVFVLNMVPNMMPDNIPLLAVSGIAAIASIVICCLKGTQGPNKYGADPLGGGEEDIFS